MTAKTVVLDFDGVLHWYRQGWADGSIYDEPTPGAVAACKQLVAQGYDPVVVSTRAATEEGVEQIIHWLQRYDFPVMAVTHTKPPAVVYIDDRGIPFIGSWVLALAELHMLDGRSWPQAMPDYEYLRQYLEEP